MTRSTINRPADKSYHGLTVGKLRLDPSLRVTVEKLLFNDDYELVMPPEMPKAGDEFLGDGRLWCSVTEKMYQAPEKAYRDASYIVRRPTEHLRMTWFFFGMR